MPEVPKIARKAIHAQKAKYAKDSENANEANYG